MNHIGKEILTLHDVTKENLYIVADFDHTLTTFDSRLSWSIFEESDLFSQADKEYFIALYKLYKGIICNLSLDDKYKKDKMVEWYDAITNVYRKSIIRENDVNNLFLNDDSVRLRPGAKRFLELMHKNSIPVLIISAGIENFIRIFLKRNNCLYDNIHICSNVFRFDNGRLIGMDGNTINDLNKQEVSIPEHISSELKRRNKTILVGDSIADARMVDESRRNDTIRVCFYKDKSFNTFEEYMQYFDIVYMEEAGYTGLIKLISKKIK